MKYRIVCPLQTSEDFHWRVCDRCRYFERHFGRGHESARCKKNRSEAHKRDFEMGFLMWFHEILVPDWPVEVEGDKET